MPRPRARFSEGIGHPSARSAGGLQDGVAPFGGYAPGGDEEVRGAVAGLQRPALEGNVDADPGAGLAQD